MVCPTCLASDKFHFSHFRSKDLTSLAILRFPVRCRKCCHRMYAGPRFAYNLWQHRRQRRQQPVAVGNPAQQNVPKRTAA